jgi:8-oxo-dGTP diphosphatase
MHDVDQEERMVVAPAQRDSRRLGPTVGVGCIVLRDQQILLVQSRNGAWSTPGGHLELREEPAECARRETAEETGVKVRDLSFVAVTNDVLPDGRGHYVTIWLRAEAEIGEIEILDGSEVAAAGWFDLDALPQPLQPFFINLLQGRCLPPLQPGAALQSSARPRSRARE